MSFLKDLKYILESLFKKKEKKPKKQSPKKVVVDEKPRIQIDLDGTYEWEGIVWHHSASPDRPLLEDWEGIRKYHTSYRLNYRIVSKKEFTDAREDASNAKFQRPWSDIGYHGGVEKINNSYQYRKGRPLSRTGAHSAVAGVSSRFNKTYIGLCIVGDFDKETPSKEAWEFCLAVTRTFMDTYKIPENMVIAHREVFDILGVVQQKSCPGSNWDMDKFRNDL